MGLHQRYEALLSDEHCHLTLAVPEKEHDKLSGAFHNMMKVVFNQQGSELSVDILKSKGVQNFISTHAGVINLAIEEAELSPSMRNALEANSYVFSGMKTIHELGESFPKLTDENGKRKTFEQFYNDVRKIDERYNKHYLRAEYNFAQAAANMAGRWEQIQEDGDNYDLQYRTAGDEHVREAHTMLDGVTLPPSDPFWDSYFPPNGWNCRCTAVQVRKKNGSRTDHSEAMRRGSEATEGKYSDMFRFNPGKERQIFPKYNPYTIRKCSSCPVANKKGMLAMAKLKISGEKLCGACQIVRDVVKDKKYLPIDKFKKTVLSKYPIQGKYTLLKTGKPLALEDIIFNEVYVVDKQIAHATRKNKQEWGKTIDAKTLVERIERDFNEITEWRYDKENDSFIFLAPYDSNRFLKYVCRKRDFIKEVKNKDMQKLEFITLGIIDKTIINQYDKI